VGSSRGGEGGEGHEERTWRSCPRGEREPPLRGTSSRGPGGGSAEAGGGDSGDVGRLLPPGLKSHGSPTRSSGGDRKQGGGGGGEGGGGGGGGGGG